MDLLWPSSGGASRSLTIPTDNNTFQVGADLGHLHARDRAGAGPRDHGRHRASSCASPSSAPRCGRWPTTARSRRRSASRCGASRPPRGSAAACCRASPGVLLADLVALDATSLTFLVISTLAATLIARLRSITITFVAAIVIGVVDAELTPIKSLEQLPRHDPVRARRDRAAGAQPAARDLGRASGGLELWKRPGVERGG